MSVHPGVYRVIEQMLDGAAEACGGTRARAAA